MPHQRRLANRSGGNSGCDVGILKQFLPSACRPRLAADGGEAVPQRGQRGWLGDADIAHGLLESAPLAAALVGS